MEEDLWHKLLILALNQDIVAYPTLAYRAGVELNNYNVETKISLHKAICCQALKIIKFYRDTFSLEELDEIVHCEDPKGNNCVDYAKGSENQEIISLINEMIVGEKESSNKRPHKDLS